ncbi:hypothetical protein Tco_0775011 [Tanacetum coccineum]
MLNRHKNWLVHKQTACGKDFSNPFMVDNLPKIVRFSTHLASVVKSWLVHDQTVHALASPNANELTIPEQTATGKGTSNPLMADFVQDSVKYLSNQGIAFATGLKRYTDPVTKLRMKHTNCRVRIPKGLYPRRIESKLTKKQVGGEWIIERETTMISKDGTISKFPEYHSFEEEEPTKQPRLLNKYGFVDHPELQRNEFAPHRLPHGKGNMNGWLNEDEDEPLEYKASNKEVESDLESTARKMAPSCRSSPSNNNDENPDIAAIIVQQLQNILPQIVTQVTANVNNVNGGNGNGGNNRCSYKTFTTCNPKEFDKKRVVQ